MEQVAFVLIVLAVGVLSLIGVLVLCNMVYEFLRLHSIYLDDNPQRCALIVILATFFIVSVLVSTGIELYKGLGL